MSFAKCMSEDAMKILDVSWIKEEPVGIVIDFRKPDVMRIAIDGDCIPVPAKPPENVIVITCTGGVLRRWPAQVGNSVW